VDSVTARLTTINGQNLRAAKQSRKLKLGFGWTWPRKYTGTTARVAATADGALRLH
jgi:hypothetical protein